MIPSYFKIEILAIRGEFVTLGHKGLIESFEIDLEYFQVIILIGTSNKLQLCTLFLHSRPRILECS